MNSLFILPLQREKGQKLPSILDQPWLKSLHSLSHVQWKDNIYRTTCEFYLKGENKGLQKRRPEQLYNKWCLHLSGLRWRRHHLELLFRHIPWTYTEKKKMYSTDAGRASVNIVSFLCHLVFTWKFIVDLRFAQELLRRKAIKHTMKDPAYNSQWKLSLWPWTVISTQLQPRRRIIKSWLHIGILKHWRSPFLGLLYMKTSFNVVWNLKQ